MQLDLELAFWQDLANTMHAQRERLHVTSASRSVHFSATAKVAMQSAVLIVTQNAQSAHAQLAYCPVKSTLQSYLCQSSQTRKMRTRQLQRCKIIFDNNIRNSVATSLVSEESAERFTLIAHAIRSIEVRPPDLQHSTMPYLSFVH